jgi:hypothetical protein
MTPQPPLRRAGVIVGSSGMLAKPAPAPAK